MLFRSVPRLSHEAPRLALSPPRPPALRPHPKRWSPGGRQRGSTFAALAARREAALLSLAPSVSFSWVPLWPGEGRLQRAAARDRNQNGARARGRALTPAARPRLEGRARVRRGEFQEDEPGNAKGPHPRGSALRPARLGA